MDKYIFNNSDCDGKYLIHVINTIFDKNIVGAEIGVSRAITSCSILQCCPNVSKLYCIDSYKPYVDFLKEPYDDIPAYYMDEKEINFIKITAYHNIKYSGCEGRINFLEMDSTEASKTIEDNSLDFIFLDAHMTKEDMDKDLKDWYPKVKNGGLISGHDWNCSATVKSVREFIENNNIDPFVSEFSGTFMWIKGKNK